jgi:hypothetical protein
MADVYIKKYWDEEDVLYYLHFSDGTALRQIEISQGNIARYTADNPVDYRDNLYDQHLDDLELEKDDFITADEFEAAWNKNT